MTHLATNRPIRIGLFDLGGRHKINLKKLIKYVNEKQHLFAFDILHTFTDNEMGLYDQLHGYSDGHFFALIRSKLINSGYSYGIGITHDALEQDRFNSHDRVNWDVGLITTNSNEDFKPVALSLMQYAAYLLLCEAFCISSHEHLEHPERRYCLFDLCIEKHDLKRCLEKPSICEPCKTRLQEIGFTLNDLKSSDIILHYVAKPSLRDVFKRTFEGIPGALCFGLLMHIVGSRLAEDRSSWHLDGNIFSWNTTVNVVLVIIILVNIVINYRGR